MKELYDQLMALCENDDTPFYYSDQGSNKELYRIFSYHFTDKDSWLLPGALESRGIMFEIDRNSNPLRIASRPMQKFFNKGEVSFINYGTPVEAMVKADGSLISSYLNYKGELKLKSKTSIGSDYANLAMELLDKNPDMKAFIMNCEIHGFTVNMELVSPDPCYRIVLHYKEPRLIILNVRDRETGKYQPSISIPNEYFTGTVDLDVLNHLDDAKNIEGYVVIDEHGNWWKEKCKWYLERHRAKDFINQPNAFIELVLKEEADDVYTLLSDQPEILKEMQDIQHMVVTKANTVVNHVTHYWENNKDLIRKDYAIKAKEELGPLEFVLAMQYYTRSEAPNWNHFFLSHIKRIDWFNEVK